MLPPSAPPTTAAFPGRLIDPVAGNLPITVTGQDDDPGALSATQFQTGLDVLRNVDEVNILSVPDAVHIDPVSIHQAMIAPLREPQGPLRGPRSAAEPSPVGTGQRRGVPRRRRVPERCGGPLLSVAEVRDPLSTAVPARTMLMPPSGHIAGVYARTDDERGVHKAPANRRARRARPRARASSDENRAAQPRGHQRPPRLPGRAARSSSGARAPLATPT